MLTGKQPYQADTPLGVAIKHITEPVPRILEANPKLPEWMEKVIATAKAKDKDDRFSTAVEMVQTIKAFMRGEAVPENKKGPATLKVSPYNKTAVVRKKRRSPVAALALGGLFLTALLAGGGFFLFRNMSAPEVEATPPPTFTVPAPTDAPAPAGTPTESVVVLEDATTVPTEPAAPPAATMRTFPSIASLWCPVRCLSPAALGLDAMTPEGAFQHVELGKTLLYMSGRTVKTVDIETLREEVVFSFLSAEYFESFHVSPDGTQAALALNRELYIIPFDQQALAGISRKSQLLALEGCLFTDELLVKGTRWSDDGKKLALKISLPAGEIRADAIRVVDIEKCEAENLAKLDEFPIGRFSFSNEIVSFDWDGDLLFFINSGIRNAGFGDLVFYNSFTRKHEKPALFSGNCCYRDATFSPDGSYVLFAFQDIRLGTESPILLYYIPSDSLDTDRELTPLPLPEGFFTRRNDAPMPALRPSQP